MSETIDQGPIDLDLDAVEKPTSKKGDYRVNWKDGRIVRLVDPRELDWQDTIGVNDPISLLKVAIHEDDRSYVEETSLPSYKLEAVFKGYLKHFDLGEPGKQRSGLLS